VVGVTKEQERLFRRMPPGGEGLLAPIFRYGVPVRVADALAMTHGSARLAHGDVPLIADETRSPRENAREAASYYAQGLTSREDLRTLGVPRGHPVVRSFLGEHWGLADAQHESRDYLVSAAPLRLLESSSGPLARREQLQENAGVVVVWHDVTEARRLIMEQRAHAETEAQRALLQTVIDELPGSIYLVRGHDARLVLANHATGEVWGTQWVVGQPMSEFLAKNSIRILRNDGRPLPLNELATIRTLQTGVSVRHFQETIRHADGTTLPVLANAVSIDPHVPGLASPDEQTHDMEPAAIMVHQDVTALKEAERIKDDFIGIAPHELRNPLAALKGFAQMLRRVPQPVGARDESNTTGATAALDAPVELNEWQREAVETIDQASNRLVELTDDLLDVMRLQAGRLELHVEPTDLVALLRRVVGRLHVITTNYTITIDATPKHIVANVDR